MITNFDISNERRKRASRLIPGGAHTYSKGDDQFPSLSPHSIAFGKGAKVTDVDGNVFVDWGMGLTSVLIGHANDEIDEAVISELRKGINFIRPSYIELEAAEVMSEIIPSCEMVKFAKNGSNATTASIKLARAYTNKEIILRCFDHPFFSIDDWFIVDTAVNSGIPAEFKKYTKRFFYNNIESLKTAIDENRGNIACVILEPICTVEPTDNFLQQVRDICTKEGIVLIFDEVITGFRVHLKGAQYYYNVTPDLSTFGKAMANGYSISAICGKREIMELGGLEHDKRRVFLLSTTYGGETHHLRAFIKNVEILKRNNYEVTDHIWYVGKTMKDRFNRIAKKFGIEKFAKCEGADFRPIFTFLDEFGRNDFYLRTLFLQEMIKKGVLVQSLNPSFSHREDELSLTEEAFLHSLNILSQAIESKNISKFLKGNPVKPVFREYN